MHISHLPIFLSFFVWSLPILRYSSSVVATNLDDLSVFKIITDLSETFFMRLFKPSFSSFVRFETCSLFLLLMHLSLYSSKILSWAFLLISTLASSGGFRGLGSVTLLHSFKSVTWRFLSSKIFSTGSKICLCHYTILRQDKFD
jgi:hypothetical protein